MDWRRTGRDQISLWLVAATVGLVLASCGSPSRGTTSEATTTNGVIVIDFNNGNPDDSYTTVDPTNGRTRSLSIPGYMRAGFDHTLTKVALIRGGELNGSAADKSTISVASLGSRSWKVIWQFVGSVNYPLSWNTAGSELAVGLAVSEDRGGNQYSEPGPGLWVVATNGSGHHKVAGGEVGPVAWSPDGSNIAFMPTTGGVPTALEVVPAAGGTPKTLASFSSGIGVSYANPTLSWSPDSRHIAISYTLYGQQGHLTSQVALYPASGGAAQTILGPSSNTLYSGASFSPDGTELAVATREITFSPASPSGPPPTTLPANQPISTPGDAIDIVGLDGSNLHSIATLNEPAVMIGWYPTTKPPRQ